MLSTTDKQERTQPMVKKETLYFAVIIALIAGFIGGIIFSAMQSTPDLPQPAKQGTAPGPDTHDHTQEQDAILSLVDLTQREPDNYQAWVSLGHNYFDTHQHEKAIQAYDRGLTINNTDPNVWTDMGIMYRRTKQPKKAIDCFAEALSRDPGHLIALFNTGLVNLTDLHNVEGAIRAWEKAVALNPDATTPDGKSLRELLEELKQTMDK
jgi:tetratricopeptide (TPR) repeat protein